MDCRLDEVIPADLAAVVDISSLHKAATDKEYLAEKGLRWVSTQLQSCTYAMLGPSCDRTLVSAQRCGCNAKVAEAQSIHHHLIASSGLNLHMLRMLSPNGLHATLLSSPAVSAMLPFWQEKSLCEVVPLCLCTVCMTAVHIG